MKVGAAIAKRQRPELVSPAKHGRALGLQQIVRVKTHLDQHHQPAVGAGMGQRLIGVRDGVLFQHMGRRGGDAPVRVAMSLMKSITSNACSCCLLPHDGAARLKPAQRIA